MKQMNTQNKCQVNDKLKSLEDNLELKIKNIRELEFNGKEKEKEYELMIEKIERENKLQIKEFMNEWETK